MKMFDNETNKQIKCWVCKKIIKPNRTCYVKPGSFGPMPSYVCSKHCVGTLALYNGFGSFKPTKLNVVR